MIELDGCQFTYRPSMIFRAEGEWLTAREPVLRPMPDGSLACLIYSGGPTEPHDENVVLITRSLDRGATWSAAEVLFKHDTRGVWATELFTEGERPCIFVHTFDAASHYLELKSYRSFFDSGTWSEPVSLPGGFGNVIARQGVVLTDGSWVFPVYWQEALGGWNWKKDGPGYQPHDKWRFVSGALRSDDGGESFSLHGNLRADINLWEPNIVEVSPNHLVMLMRADGVPLKYRSESVDGGRTWSPPEPSDIPDANSKMTLLRWGQRVILLHNPAAVAGWLNRRTLSLWVSEDGCKTWPIKIDLAKGVEGDLIVCYPHAFIDHDEQILYVACDTAVTHYLLKVPLADIVAAL